MNIEVTSEYKISLTQDGKEYTIAFTREELTKLRNSIDAALNPNKPTSKIFEEIVSEEKIMKEKYKEYLQKRSEKYSPIFPLIF